MHGMGEWRPVVMPGAETFEIASARTGEIYRVLVRRPAGEAPERGWPVLWMLDGDASFPLTFAKPAHGLFAPAADAGGAGVVVAVGFPGGAPFDAPARSRNYTPKPDGETGDRVSTEFGGNKPDNLFGAGFIGSPRMNFVTGEAAKPWNAPTVGIRPEHLKLSKEAGSWKGLVGVAEHLGSDTFLHVNAEGVGMLTVRADGDFPVKHGDTVWLTPDHTRIHRFDEKGLAVR